MARLIDADALLNTLRGFFDRRQKERLTRIRTTDVMWNDAIYHIKIAPTVDAVPVVRCRDCVKWEEYDNTAGNGYCLNKRYMFRYGGIGGRGEMEFNPITEPEFSCADGERKGGDADG